MVNTFRNEVLKLLQDQNKGGYGPCIWGGWVGGWVGACMGELRDSPCIVALLACQWAPYGTVSKCVAKVTHVHTHIALFGEHSESN